MHQRRTSAAAHVIHAFRNQCGGLRGIASVAVTHEQVLESREVRRDVATGRLHLTLHGDAQPVVLDVEEHRQLERGRDGERRPEAVRRHTGLAAEGHRDRAAPLHLVERAVPIPNRLRPAGGGSVLRSHVSGHGKHGRTMPSRHVAYDADVAPVAETPCAAKGAAEGVRDREPQRQQQRPRAIVRADAIARLVQQRAEDDLADVVTSRRKLVEHEMLARHAAAIAVGDLLHVIQGTRHQHVVRDALPVKAGIDIGRRAAGCLLWNGMSG